MSHDLCDLEIHRYPHTVPFKVKAKRLGVFQLDSGLGKGAEQAYLDDRHRECLKGAGRLSNQSAGLPGIVLRPDPWSAPHGVSIVPGLCVQAHP